MSCIPCTTKLVGRAINHYENQGKEVVYMLFGYKLYEIMRQEIERLSLRIDKSVLNPSDSLYFFGVNVYKDTRRSHGVRFVVDEKLI